MTAQTIQAILVEVVAVEKARAPANEIGDSAEPSAVPFGANITEPAAMPIALRDLEPNLHAL